MADALDNAVNLASLYSELMFGEPDVEKLKITCLTDCKSLFEAVRSNKAVAEKYRDLRI